ncbi:hypothetical protein AALA69_08250 [Eggerthellaceae bacterium 24-137]
MIEKRSERDDIVWNAEIDIEAEDIDSAEIARQEDEALDMPPAAVTEDIERMREQLDLGVEGAGRTYQALIKSQPSSRIVFWKILGFCQSPRSSAEMKIFVADLQAHRRSVYEAADYCRMLEECQCLKRVNAEGHPYDSALAEPTLIEVGGQECLVAAQPLELFWKTTQRGRAAYEEEKPLETLMNCIAQHGSYRSVYARILDLTSIEGGMSIADIKADVNALPDVGFPAKTAQFFIEHLQRHQAIEWDGAWKITKLGETARESLARALATNDR